MNRGGLVTRLGDFLCPPGDITQKKDETGATFLAFMRKASMRLRGTNKEIIGGRTRRAGLSLAMAAAALASTATPAEALGATAGACLLTITLSRPTAVPPTLDDPIWNVVGNGPCAVLPPGVLPGVPAIPGGIPGDLVGYVNDNVVSTGSLNGTVSGISTTSAGCAAGALEGALVFNPGGDRGPTTSDLVRGVLAGAVLVLGMKKTTTFVGAGVFAQTSTERLVDCAEGGASSSTWTGLFVFGDGTQK